MVSTPPDLNIKTNEVSYSDNILSVMDINNEMRYYKMEMNYDFEKVLNINFLFPTIMDQNSNFTGISSVGPMTNADEVYQMYTLKQITYGKKVDANYKLKFGGAADSSKNKSDPVKPIKKVSSQDNTFLKALESIPRIHRPVFDPPCPWLEKRLYVDNLCASDTQWEEIAAALRENFIYLATDLCIFHATQSHFMFTIVKVEAYNIMRLLALPAIQDYNSKLSKELLKNLFNLINHELNQSVLTVQEIREISKDLIWNYYKFVSPRARSLKDAIRETPKILYYSLWLNDDLIPGISKRKIDSRFIRIERTFRCKIILRRNLGSVSSNKNNDTLMEIYFDYNHGQFGLAIANINKLIREYHKNLYRDLTAHQAMVSFVSKDFFCCEEMSSLIEREYVMDDMSYHFIQLMHWLKAQRIGHYIF